MATLTAPVDQIAIVKHTKRQSIHPMTVFVTTQCWSFDDCGKLKWRVT